MAKKLSQRAVNRIKKAGLVPPAPDLSQAQFAKLQKQWYDKLAKEGFDDIEWVDHRTGQGHNSGFLKGSLISGKVYHPGRELYYQLASNYLMHCANLKNKSYDRFIWKMHAEGATYDEIEAAVKRKYRKAPSKFTLYYQIKHLAKLCYRWNAKHPEGLLRKRAEEKQSIEEKGLEDFYAEEYNWMINKEFAAREVSSGKRFPKNTRK